MRGWGLGRVDRGWGCEGVWGLDFRGGGKGEWGMGKGV